MDLSLLYGLDDLKSGLEKFMAEEDTPPGIIVCADCCAFALGRSEKLADTARQLFIDDLKIAVYTESFGGHHFMPQKNMDFIRSWEVEKYRAAIHKDKE